MVNANLKLLLAILFCISGAKLFAQTDTSDKISHRLERIESELKNNPILKKNYEDLTFYYSELVKSQVDSLKNPGFKVSGYIDAYYAHYSDKLPIGSYQKFPTSAPISDAFSLNMAMVSFQYQNDNLNGIISLHAGDIAQCAWSQKYNFLQEAHLGVKLVKNLWIEGGFFRTHLGFESIQPRENIGSTIALTTYYEPYFLSGSKLTYFINPRLSIQFGMFNGFNTFVAINKHKTYSFSLGYESKKHLIVSWNILYSNETPDSVSPQKKRLYNDLYFAYKSNKFDVGFETNFGFQSNSQIQNPSKMALMYSSTIAGKYKFLKGKYSIYARAELFEDSDEILTGPVQNDLHQLVGINAIGFNYGFEYKPLPNSFLRIETRYLKLNNKENIFLEGSHYSNSRTEFVASMGLWF